MYTPEPVETINQRLIDYYGKFETGDPKFRVVWSEDQFERKLIKTTPEGLALLTPVLGTARKYNYIRNKYVLEMIVVVPESHIDDVGGKISYEPIWTFEDGAGNPLPPKWEVIQAIFQSIDELMKPKAPYKQDEKDGNTLEAMEDRARILEEQLFGNETSVGDALAHDSAVGFGSRTRNDSRFNKLKIH